MEVGESGQSLTFYDVDPQFAGPLRRIDSVHQAGYRRRGGPAEPGSRADRLLVSSVDRGGRLLPRKVGFDGARRFLLNVSEDGRGRLEHDAGGEEEIAFDPHV